MKESGAIVWAGLMPHAPVLVPAVGQGRETEVSSTVRAMKTLAVDMVSTSPDLLIVISPHSPRRPGAFGIWQTPRITGDLARFGCPDVGVDLPNDTATAYEIGNNADVLGLTTLNITGQKLDHGATVPLWFISKAGWRGPTIVLGLNYPKEGRHKDLAAALARTLDGRSKRVALLASGDMSHALKEGGPAGFHPLAAEFDRQVIDALSAGDYRRLQAMDQRLQDAAAEDVIDSTLIVTAAIGWHHHNHQLLSYEGPFGVGYSVARLHHHPAK